MRYVYVRTYRIPVSPVFTQIVFFFPPLSSCTRKHSCTLYIAKKKTILEHIFFFFTCFERLVIYTCTLRKKAQYHSNSLGCHLAWLRATLNLSQWLGSLRRPVTPLSSLNFSHPIYLYQPGCSKLISRTITNYSLVIARRI